MNKKVIRLTESDLHNIVEESVNRVLKESYLDGDYKGINIPSNLDYNKWARKIDNALYSGWQPQQIQGVIDDAARRDVDNIPMHV